MTWIQEVKAYQKSHGCTYKKALQEASKQRKAKGGATWNLTPEQKAQYIADKQAGRNIVKRGEAYFWQP